MLLSFNEQQHSEDSRIYLCYHHHKAARNQGKAAGRVQQESCFTTPWISGKAACLSPEFERDNMGSVCSGKNFFRDVVFMPHYKEQMIEMMLTTIERACEPEKDCEGQTD